MAGPIDASCVACGAMSPRSEAASGEGDLQCPACGATVVRGLPEQYSALTTEPPV